MKVREPFVEIQFYGPNNIRLCSEFTIVMPFLFFCIRQNIFATFSRILDNCKHPET